MVVIGLVGRIGAGKTTVAGLFAQHGARVIDADRLAHEVLDEQEVRELLVRQFGPVVIGVDGQVDRRRLAAIVFGERAEAQASLRELEAIVHPRVRRRIAAALTAEREAAADSGKPPRVVVLDVPLLVQGGYVSHCDHLVWIECDDSVRHDRLKARGLSPEQIAAREEAWSRGFDPASLPVEKLSRVDTGESPAYTREKVDRIWRGLMATG